MDILQSMCVTLWVFEIWWSLLHKNRIDARYFLLKTKDLLNRRDLLLFLSCRGILISVFPELKTSYIL